MAILADYHLHSHHSGDTDVSMESMVEAAIAAGLTDMCFTEHNDPDYVYVKPEDTGMFDLDIPAYYEAYLKIRETYGDQINIRFGMELGLQPHLADMLPSIVKSKPFDFILGSSHLCHRMDTFFPYFFEGRSAKEAMTEYFVSIKENLEVFHDFDVYAHLDYPIRYPKEKDASYRYADYTDLLDEILKTLIEGGKGLEINTGGLRKGLRSTNPCEEILKRYRELGGEIITTASDAHEPAIIADHFAESAAILKRCGFKYYTIFRERKPIFLPLD